MASSTEDKRSVFIRVVLVCFFLLAIGFPTVIYANVPPEASIDAIYVMRASTRIDLLNDLTEAALWGETLHIEGSGTDPDGDSVTVWEWRYDLSGTGTIISNGAIDHNVDIAVKFISAPPVVGNSTYDIILKVMDEHGAYSDPAVDPNAVGQIRINAKPVAEIAQVWVDGVEQDISGGIVIAGQTQMIQFTGSVTDDYGTGPDYGCSYAWMFDGTTLLDSNRVTGQIPLDSVSLGDHEVSFIATDKEGESSQAATITLTVNENPSRVIVVDPVPGVGDYQYIQEAIDNAQAGDIIQVNNGTYDEDITLIDSIRVRSRAWFDACGLDQRILPDTAVIQGKVAMADNTKLLGFKIEESLTAIESGIIEVLTLINIEDASDVEIAYNTVKLTVDSTETDDIGCGIRVHDSVEQDLTKVVDVISIHNNVVVVETVSGVKVRGISVEDDDRNRSAAMDIGIINNTVDARSAGLVRGLYVPTFRPSSTEVFNNIVAIGGSEPRERKGVCIYKDSSPSLITYYNATYVWEGTLNFDRQHFNVPHSIDAQEFVITAKLAGLGFGTLPPGYDLDDHITADPNFTDAAAGDYTLSEDSPCIDEGWQDPDLDGGNNAGMWWDYTFEDQDTGDRVNMGAYGNTSNAQATCWVTFEDLVNFVDDWLKSGPGWPADLYSDENINFKDYAIFADYWHSRCPDGWPLKD